MRQTDKFASIIPQTDAEVDAFRPQISNQRETICVFWSVLKSYYFLFIGQVKHDLNFCIKSLKPQPDCRVNI